VPIYCLVVTPQKSAVSLAQDHWNETPLYLSEEDRYSTYPWLYRVAEFREHPGERVLELGCGTGCDLLQFAKHGAIATGVDITDSHLELARKRVGGTATVVKADIRSMDFEDNSFDYVYSHGVIHHSNEPKKIVAEILRVLRPGGRFNIHVYALYSYFALWRLLQYGRRWKFYVENSTSEVHIDLYTAASLRTLFHPVRIQIRKYQAKPFELLAPALGWYLVATGSKPVIGNSEL
jgi:ubiquinone/menaquinone biosynthesis C-methylase UbiE